jgi:hypothetical protein
VTQQQQLLDAKPDPVGVRVVHIKAENVKRIVLVDWEPGPHLNVIAGDNGAGKSSLLDCLPYLFGGEKALPQEPLRRGAESGYVAADLGAFTVERRFTKKGSYLKVTSKDGLSYPSPQSMLDAFWAEVAFDPGAWLRKPAREQRAELLRIADMKLDVAANRAARQVAYEERRDVGRDLKRAEGALADAGPAPEVPAARPHGVVFGEYEVERGRAEKRGRLVADLDARRHEIVRLNREYAEWVRSIEAEQERRKKAIEAAQKSEADLARAIEAEPVVTDERLSGLRAEMDASRAAEQARVKLADHARLKGQVDGLALRTKELSERIGSLDEELVLALRAADFPVPGLSVGEEGVVFDGFPLDQASHAEQLRVALAVAMRVQKKRGRHLRLVRMSDGDRFDSKSMELVRAEAEAHDFQILMERVSKDGASIVIEDGTVAKAHGMPPHHLGDGETPERGDQQP